MLFELIILFVVLSVVVIFLCFVCNQDFWQGERNTKFLDKVYHGDFDDFDSNLPFVK